MTDTSEGRGGGGVGRFRPRDSYSPIGRTPGKNFTGGPPQDISFQAKGAYHHGAVVVPNSNINRRPRIVGGGVCIEGIELGGGLLGGECGTRVVGGRHPTKYERG